VHQANPIGLDGLEGKRENVADLCARFAFDDELQYLPRAG
jgi:hypothetical protein